MRRFLLLLLGIIATSAHAQSYSSAGQSWGSVYGFNSASDRSVSLSRANQIREAERGASQPVYNTYYDNRSGYIETNSEGGNVGSTQIGDTVGEQTYSVGALNTGSTTVTITGTGNTVSANNSAATTGCVNGSITHSTMSNGMTNDGASVQPPITDGSTSTVTNPNVAATTCAP